MPLRNIDKGISGPQMHVFLIGVGYYAASATEEEIEDVGRDFQRPEPITTPVHSVQAMYDFICDLDHRGEWITPLGTIEILLSDTAEQTEGLQRATMDNIQRAYSKWYRQCDTHKDNVALFYFCGHGLGKGEHFLLAEDFAEHPENPMAGAIAFDATRTAFKTCKAQTQVFIVDACQTATLGMTLWDLSQSARPLQSPRFGRKFCPYDLTIKAAAPNEQALARPGQPAILTQAVIAGLRGLAARDPENDWVVSTSYLTPAMPALIAKIDQEAPTDLYEINNRGCIPLVRLSSTPRVNMTVSCDPDEAHAIAELSYQHSETGVGGRREAPDTAPWELEVDAGIYDLKAEFPDKRYPVTKKSKKAEPPICIAKIKCL